MSEAHIGARAKRIPLYGALIEEEKGALSRPSPTILWQVNGDLLPSLLRRAFIARQIGSPSLSFKALPIYTTLLRASWS